MGVNYFEQETARSLRIIGNLNTRFMWFKIPDTKMLRYKSGNDNLIADPVPCDYIALFAGKCSFIECKSSKSSASFSLRYIKDHQLEYLLNSEKCGGKGWFIINSRKGRGSIKAFAVHPKIVKSWFDQDLKSVKWDDMALQSISLKRIDNGCWDFKPIFMMC